MSENIFWKIDMKINSGKLDEFKQLMTQMVDDTKKNEPGALNYEWFISDDQIRCHLYERYADSAAAMIHLGNFMQNFVDRFMALVEVIEVTVYGDPDDAIRDALGRFGAVFMAPLGGFVR